jgi:hypothetical protein
MKYVVSAIGGSIVGYGMGFVYQIMLNTLYIELGLTPNVFFLDSISNILSIITAISVAFELLEHQRH